MVRTWTRKLIAVLMVGALVFSLAACGANKGEGAGSGQASNVYATAKAMLDLVWDNTSKDMPAFGGNFETNVENEPGTLDLEDKDTMTNGLLIPEEVQDKITDVATLFHMMNANTFTSAALKLDGISADEAAGKMKDAFKNNAFMCGTPDKIVIYTVGNDLVYFFGAEDIVDEFKAAAENLEGGKLVVEEDY